MEFVELGREALRSAPFLDQRGIPPGARRVEVPIEALVNERAAKGPTDFPPAIFHTAFCCSTLLAKALDRPGSVLSLKEPAILMDLANAYRMLPGQGRQHELPDLTSLVLALLSETAAEGETLLLKPTNAANNLLPLWIASGAAVILISSTLEDFLVSVIKKGEACRAFVRRQFNIFCLDETALGQIPHRQAMTFTDLQVAALVWRHQREAFYRLHQSHHAKILTLTDRSLLEDPAGTLKDVAHHLGLAMSASEADEIAAGSVFRRDVKNPDQRLNGTARRIEQDSLREAFKVEIDQILHWSTNVAMDNEALNFQPRGPSAC